MQEKNSNFQNVRNMNIEKLEIEQLIKAGAHFGHPVRKWNPNFKQFIVTKKNGIHIIDVKLTLKYLDKAVAQMIKIASSGGYVLFVGTKPQARDTVQFAADNSGMFYIIERWLGGTLTNFSTIKKSIKRLKLLEKESNPIYANLTKKEIGSLNREKIKLAVDMRHLPSAIFVVDANHEKIAVSEAKCLGIPTLGLVYTNTDPFILDYPIPANDDSIKTIKLILNYISESLNEALGNNTQKVEEPNEIENKEVSTDS